MKTLSTTIKALTCTVFILAMASIASAQATRTWVSGVGDDVNPCSRTAPCKTYAGAISKTAANGEISTLDPGGFGAVTITKSMTIDGTNGQGYGSILAAGTTGVNVNDSATATPNTIKVRLRNLSIHGANTGVHGINFTSGKQLFIENCVIYGFQSSATSRGIRVNLGVSASQRVFIKDTNIANNASGVEITGTGTVTFLMDNCRVEGMTDGVILGTNANGAIRNSVLAMNTGVGLKVTGAGSNVELESSQVQQNGTGVQPFNGGTVVFSNTSVLGNTTGVSSVAGAILTSHGNNQFTLNGGGVLPTNIGQQ